MFENIIGQDKAVSLLRDEIEGGSLPASILIHGEPYSGKLSIALEIARVLSCTGDTSWGCDCRSCAQHRLLQHPGTLLLGSRAFAAEIAASADVLRRKRSTAARYLYVRALRKLTRRCDQHLWEGAEARMRGAFAAAEEIEENLREVEPGRPLPEGEALERLLGRVAERSGHVASALPRDNTPINVIRKTAFWARLSSTTGDRAVIIENADRMVDASRNSLLKLLEEPPAGLHLILLTTNVQAIIATIISRVRRYRLEPRSEESARAVLSRVFHVEAGAKAASLSEYFLSWDKVPEEQTAGLAEAFLGALRSPELDERPLIALYDKCQRESAVDQGAFFRQFAARLGERMHARWREGALERPRLDAWNRMLQDAASEQASLNLQPMLLLQATLYRMREAREPA